MDREWVMATIAELAGFSTGGPGITRLAYSDEDRRAGEYIQELMRQSGLTVRRDAFGNIIGRLEGAVSGAPAVATGSHLLSSLASINKVPYYWYMALISGGAGVVMFLHTLMSTL